MKEEKTIMYDSPEAASKMTVEGWVSREGRFCADDEHWARLTGCTHIKCRECGTPHRKSWAMCKKCREKKHEIKIQKAYEKMDVVEWDESVPVVICGEDTYFNSWDEARYYCEEYDCTVESLRLVICVGVPMPQIEIDDLFCDSMSEDQDVEDIEPDIVSAIECLNSLIEKSAPMSFHEGDKAVKI